MEKETLVYPSVAPMLAIRGAVKAIEFYKAAFDAVEIYRLTDPANGKIGYAEMTINGALIMVSDEYPEFNKAPDTLGGTSIRLHVMCKDVETAFAQAVKAGATPVLELSDQFYGHRSGRVRDPFGHEWILSQLIERVSPEEMQRRWNEMAKG